MASGYLALMALCCCINGVSEAAFAIEGKNKGLYMLKPNISQRLKQHISFDGITIEVASRVLLEYINLYYYKIW